LFSAYTNKYNHLQLQWIIVLILQEEPLVANKNNYSHEEQLQETEKSC